MDKMRREVDELRTLMKQQAAAMSKPTPSSVEEELRKQIADLHLNKEADLAKFMMKEAEYRREPYKALTDQRRDRVKALSAGFHDQPVTRTRLFKEYASAAKNGGLDPRDSVLIHALLSPADFQLKLVKILLSVPAPQTRAAMFNTLVMDEGDSSFETANGEIISQIPWPLFPIRQEFTDLNTELLREASSILEGSTIVHGAGPARPVAHRRLPSVFANPDREQAARLVTLVRGAGYAPVADGRADLSEVEAAFDYMASQIVDLRNQVNSLKGQIKGNGGGGRGKGNARGGRGRGRGNNNHGGGYNSGYQNNGYNGNSYNNRVRGGGAEEDLEEENQEGGSM